MIPRSPLDDPKNSAHAWGRFWRMMRWAAFATFVLLVLVLGWIYLSLGLVSIHIYLGAALAIVLLVPITAALMGLMFLSSGTGHDQAIANPLEDDEL